MKIGIVLVGAVLLVGLVQAGLAAPAPAKRGVALTALGKKLLGTWKGQGGCDGHFVFRADGTYALTEYGPAHDDSTGTWKVHGDALPSTLRLTCKTSGITDEVGKTTEVKLIKLDDKMLAIEYTEQNGSPSGHYTRARK